MSEFETVLQECLHDVEQGLSSIEECLRRYPRHAAQLEPVLLTSAYLARAREAQLSPVFKARVRTRLVQQMYAHPRRSARPQYLFMRLAVSLAALMLALLAAGTVYAQRALPGEAFYAWKLASENAWRAVSPDPVGTDLAIAERRLQELIAVRNDPILEAQTLNSYLQVTERLMAQLDPANEARILSVLDAQAEELIQLDVLPEEPTPGIVPPLEESTVTPVATSLPILETPLVNPTELPQIVPTVEVVPEILPTAREQPKIIPTLEIPPSLP
jgi:hypothetical protein